MRLDSTLIINTKKTQYKYLGVHRSQISLRLAYNSPPVTNFPRACSRGALVCCQTVFVLFGRARAFDALATPGASAIWAAIRFAAFLLGSSRLHGAISASALATMRFCSVSGGIGIGSGFRLAALMPFAVMPVACLPNRWYHCGTRADFAKDYPRLFFS